MSVFRILEPAHRMRRMSLYKLLVKIHLLIRICRIPIRQQRHLPLPHVPLNLHICARRTGIVNSRGNGICDFIGSSDKLRKARIKVVRGRQQTAPSALGSRVFEAQRAPKIVIA